MNEDDQPSPQNKLDYASPVKRRGSPASVEVGVIGILVGLFGLLMLGMFGVGSVFYLFIEHSGRDFAGDIFEGAIGTLIGTVSLFAGIRWLRTGFRRRGE